jgi:hypothetical protein
MAQKFEDRLRIGANGQSGTMNLWLRLHAELRSMRMEEMDRAFYATAHGMLYKPVDGHEPVRPAN